MYKILCKKCKKEIDADSKFCANCGYELKDKYSSYGRLAYFFCNSIVGKIILWLFLIISVIATILITYKYIQSNNINDEYIKIYAYNEGGRIYHILDGEKIHIDKVCNESNEIIDFKIKEGEAKEFFCHKNDLNTAIDMVLIDDISIFLLSLSFPLGCFFYCLTFILLGKKNNKKINNYTVRKITFPLCIIIMLIMLLSGLNIAKELIKDFSLLKADNIVKGKVCAKVDTYTYLVEYSVNNCKYTCVIGDKNSSKRGLEKDEVVTIYYDKDNPSKSSDCDRRYMRLNIFNIFLIIISLVSLSVYLLVYKLRNLNSKKN